jgi:hypothetical protein
VSSAVAIAAIAHLADRLDELDAALADLNRG